MCGFAGELSFVGAADRSAVERMAETMQSRGPDGAGAWAMDAVALAHRRLKIIDLSAAGDQPMVDEQLGLTIVFNGCIYNHHELRRELESDGYRFFSHSDTEVILKAYDRWGGRCVERLFGMFAFAVFDHGRGRLTLARDRLGIKPLYLTQGRDSVRFASTLPALLAGGGVDTDIDPVALHHFFSWHGVVPAPYTILKGVRKLAPATVMTVEADGESAAHTYWSADYSSRPELYRRCDEDRVRDERGELTEVARAVLGPWLSGNLGLVNAFGNGLADDKLVHGYVDDFVRFYLGQEPSVPSVPTHDFERSADEQETKDRLREHVVKPRHGHGGTGVVIGPQATGPEIEELAGEVARRPQSYISQPTISLSSHPTVIDDHLEPRHVDLRVFAFAGAQIAFMPGGLSRVALEKDKLIVNSSQSGGGKDTWVL